jgi:hypothetical protein
MDSGGWILLGLFAGFVAYIFGENRGRKAGYKQAQAEDQQWVRKVSQESAYLRSENAKLSQENGSLRKESEIVKNLLRQQPTTPEAEAILKAVGRVELQLTQFLPSAFEDGENHDGQIN